MASAAEHALPVHGSGSIARLPALALLLVLVGCPAPGEDPADETTMSAAEPARGAGADGAGAVSVVASEEPATPDRLPSATAAAPTGSRWVLVEGIEGTDPDSPPSLQFDSQTHISGSGGCNGYGAEVALAGARIEVGRLAATKRGCPGARGRSEPAFFEALSEATAWRQDGGRLVLERRGGPALVFEPAADAGASPR